MRTLADFIDKPEAADHLHDRGLEWASLRHDVVAERDWYARVWWWFDEHRHSATERAGFCDWVLALVYGFPDERSRASQAKYRRWADEMGFTLSPLDVGFRLGFDQGSVLSLLPGDEWRSSAPEEYTDRRGHQRIALSKPDADLDAILGAAFGR